MQGLCIWPYALYKATLVKGKIMNISPVIFREYDIRGVYNSDFDNNFAELLGKALVTYYHNELNIMSPLISLGMDARSSSPEIIASLSKGITESGGSVVLIGLVTSPVTYFTTFYYPDIDGAVMVTGSHNPPEYNGFKICIGKSSLYGDGIKNLEKIIRAKDFKVGKGSIQNRNVFPDYIKKHKDEFGDLSGVSVVLDCGNGAGGSVARQLFESVGVKAKILFEEPDGRFPNHHPDPTVEKNLKWLKDEVNQNSFKVGIGFDGDADRIGVVDENGDMIYGDELIALFAKDVLKTHPQEKIIGDVKCSDRLYSYIEKHNGQPVMWKTGHSLIKQKIKDESSPFGGELSGHIFFSDRNYGYDDALYAGLRLIEIMKKEKKGPRAILADFPKAVNTPEIRIDTTEEKKQSIVDALKSHFKESSSDLKANLIDGIRVSYPFGWGLARASNTQPVLVLRFEADTSENLKVIQDEFESIVKPLLN